MSQDVECRRSGMSGQDNLFSVRYERVDFTVRTDKIGAWDEQVESRFCNRSTEDLLWERRRVHVDPR